MPAKDQRGKRCKNNYQTQHLRYDKHDIIKSDRDKTTTHVKHDNFQKALQRQNHIGQQRQNQEQEENNTPEKAPLKWTMKTTKNQSYNILETFDQS